MLFFGQLLIDSEKAGGTEILGATSFVRRSRGLFRYLAYNGMQERARGSHEMGHWPLALLLLLLNNNLRLMLPIHILQYIFLLCVIALEVLYPSGIRRERK